jgi:hypothetical protein
MRPLLLYVVIRQGGDRRQRPGSRPGDGSDPDAWASTGIGEAGLDLSGSDRATPTGRGRWARLASLLAGLVVRPTRRSTRGSRL